MLLPKNATTGIDRIIPPQRKYVHEFRTYSFLHSPIVEKSRNFSCNAKTSDAEGRAGFCCNQECKSVLLFLPQRRTPCLEGGKEWVMTTG